MLRIALTYLLAVVLSLNGLLMPLAVAGSAAEASTAAALHETGATCHGETTPGTDSRTEAVPVQPDAPHDTSCCNRSHCVCGCLFSLAIAASGTNALPALSGQLMAAAAVLPHSSARLAVPQRPPIA